MRRRMSAVGASELVATSLGAIRGRPWSCASASPQLARPRRLVPIQTANSSASSTNGPRTPVVPAVENTR
jgi:hypothetical protein